MKLDESVIALPKGVVTLPEPYVEVVDGVAQCTVIWQVSPEGKPQKVMEVRRGIAKE